jgi:hypothetical protein
LGIAVISLLLPSTASCPNTIWLPRTKALTRWAMPLLSHARSKLRRMALPSIAISRPPDASASADTHATKHRSNASGSSAANTRPNVSWLGTPPGRPRNVLNHASLLRANNSTSAHPSAPQITAQTARTTMSFSRCTTLRARGSGRSRK